jgi:aryl-alcohol dehydrogenase-like predicted oxidoreductase
MMGGAPSLWLGTSLLGTSGGDGPAFELLDAFVDRGGCRVDTARVYSDWIPGEIGRSERSVGD